MKAICWYGKPDVRVEEVADPHVINPRDGIVRVTAVGIGGSDLTIYRGLIPGVSPGDVLGHEVVGEVEEVGEDAHVVGPGDRVVVPFALGCGRCHYCQQGLWSLCDNSNPSGDRAAVAHGHAPVGLLGYGPLFGGYAGGQAEFVRVPCADVALHALPDDIPDEQAVLLADGLPTGYMAAEQCGIREGDVVTVWGCGAVGQAAIMAAYSLGAERVIAIDTAAERLATARDVGGAVVLDAGQADVLEALRELTGGRGPDACIEAVGMADSGSTLGALHARARRWVGAVAGQHQAPRQAILACRKGGIVSIVGSYASLVDEFPSGAVCAKALTLSTAYTPVHGYIPKLLEALQRGDLAPASIVSHTLPLDDAARGYRMKDEQSDGALKVVLKPPSAYEGEQEETSARAVEPLQVAPGKLESDR